MTIGCAKGGYSPVGTGEHLLRNGFPRVRLLILRLARVLSDGFALGEGQSAGFPLAEGESAGNRFAEGHPTLCKRNLNRTTLCKRNLNRRTFANRAKD